VIALQRQPTQLTGTADDEHASRINRTAAHYSLRGGLSAAAMGQRPDILRD
jgi:hypothetical protein